MVNIVLTNLKLCRKLMTTLFQLLEAENKIHNIATYLANLVSRLLLFFLERQGPNETLHIILFSYVDNEIC